MAFTEEQRIRKEQVESTRRTISMPERAYTPERSYPAAAPATTKFKAKGHDAVLQALQDGRRTTRIIKTSGDELTGTIVGRDKFTITLAVDGVRRVIYKHAIEEFFSIESEAA